MTMLKKPHIATIEAQTTAIIRLTIPRSEIRTVVGPGIQELKAAVAAQGIAPAGPWFIHQLRMEPQIYDFEIGVPVARPVAAAGRVEPGTLRYEVWQQREDPTSFVHIFTFRDAEADRIHAESKEVKKFASILYPSCLAPVEFVDYDFVATNR